METNDRIINYFNKVVDDNNKLILLKLLNTDEYTFRLLIDLLLDYKITLRQIDEWGDFSQEGLLSLIKTTDLNLTTYYATDEVTGDIGKYFLLNNLNMRDLINLAIEEDLKKKEYFNVFDKVLKIKINDENSKDSYKNKNQFLEEFKTKVWEELKKNFNFKDSLHEIFPYETETQIKPLFSSIKDQKIVQLGLNIYESIFRRFFHPVDYLRFYNEEVMYLLYHVNDRYSKLENEVILVNNIMNINYLKYDFLNSVLNNVGMLINKQGSVPVISDTIKNDPFIDELVNHFDELDFGRNTEYAMNVFFILTTMYERFYNISDTDYMKCYEIIKSQLDLFIRFINNFIDLSNNYLLTYE